MAKKFRLRRYNHNRSNLRGTGFNMGLWIPTASRHCIAGTTVRGGVAAGLELSPMVHQAMTQIRVITKAISIADRLIWDDAEDFYTGGADGNQRPEPPYIMSPSDVGWSVGSLADHLGFPTGVPNLKCNALPFRLYAFWYNENVRREGLQDELPFATTSGLDTVTNTELAPMNWSKDMFTTATLEPQLGDEVVIPIASSAPVSIVGNNEAIVIRGATGGTGNPVVDRALVSGYGEGSDASSLYVGTGTGKTSSGLPAQPGATSPSSLQGMKPYSAVGFGEQTGLTGTADLSNATGILPSDFNFAMAQQKWKVRRNMYGAKFKDWLAFMGIRYSDRRLSLPTTLATGRQYVDISAVVQTAPGNDSFVGQAAGRATSFAACRYKTYFEEPTTVIHLIGVMPATMYVNMNPLEWDWDVREDLPTPEYMHVGMVLRKIGTLFPTGNEEEDNRPFGYTNRYDEFRAAFNDVSGDMKSVSLSYHQGRVFENAPSLSGEFLAAPPSPRIFADLEAGAAGRESQIKAAAIRNTFIVRDYVTPNGDPRY